MKTFNPPVNLFRTILTPPVTFVRHESNRGVNKKGVTLFLHTRSRDFAAFIWGKLLLGSVGIILAGKIRLSTCI